MKVNYSFPILHWLTSIFIAPILFLCATWLEDGATVAMSDSSMIPAFLFVGVIFSVPVVVIYFLLYSFLVNVISSTLLIKVILCATAISWCCVVIIVLTGTMDKRLCIVYSVSIIIASMFYKVSKSNSYSRVSL